MDFKQVLFGEHLNVISIFFVQSLSFSIRLSKFLLMFYIFFMNQTVLLISHYAGQSYVFFVTSQHGSKQFVGGCDQ